ncbi:M28 family peptidase [Pelomyxa schiedti]|nr:M28 family peptidase [Pelomyxa schiedti]
MSGEDPWYAGQKVVLYYDCVHKSGFRPAFPSSQAWFGLHPVCRVPKFAHPALQYVLSLVNEREWFSYVNKMTSFSRYAFGEGINDARSWLLSEMNSIPGVKVTTEGVALCLFGKSPSKGLNIITTVPAFGTDLDSIHGPDGIAATSAAIPKPPLAQTSAKRRKIVIGGHYDSTSENKQCAPGAVDNASGASAVIHLARIFSKTKPLVDMEFVLFDGEEVGTYGSEERAEKTAAEDVIFMLNIDMIGLLEPNPILQYESIPKCSRLVQLFYDVTKGLRVPLEPRVTLDAWGSDHVSYLERDMPALLVSINDCVKYANYHSSRDLPHNLSLDIGYDTLCVLTLAIALVALLGVDPQVSLESQGISTAGLFRFC